MGALGYVEWKQFLVPVVGWYGKKMVIFCMFSGSYVMDQRQVNLLKY